MAFWFASRGVGQIKMENGETVPYTSQAKVLLSGLGADEQLGGYSRHKDQFAASGWEGLIHELQLDLDRISTRNLGEFMFHVSPLTENQSRETMNIALTLNQHSHHLNRTR